MDVALLLRKYLPHMVSFGMFARVTDITPKSVEELKNLRHLKLDCINIGIETAHDPTLDRMNKGYHASDIRSSCQSSMWLESATMSFISTDLEVKATAWQAQLRPPMY